MTREEANRIVLTMLVKLDEEADRREVNDLVPQLRTPVAIQPKQAAPVELERRVG